MNITVFGANGNVGTLVVRRALDQGHQVHAFVHSRDPFDPHPQLHVSAGDVADGDAVNSAVTGADAVISTLGAFRRGTGAVLTPGLRTITAAMEQHSCDRLVILTGAGIRRPAHRNTPRTHLNRLVLTVMDRTAVADAETALAIVAATTVNWTAVCAPTITPNGPDLYQLTDRMPSLLSNVPGPAVAASLVDLATHPTTEGPVVGIHTRTQDPA
ncbi:NAD(P)H-binding [Friedmanniella luteola]|uniref:NAD(P)H-binding n=1 Tax=Friedmanniella luteola TaxID=546871 RepID=A0A1H1WMK3_9ACTN|nr:NAD(P)H-binding protein [Friedmanniella luteola]SDS98403.1 NAD(P)H-binding [Friedmanniella luteola]